MANQFIPPDERFGGEATKRERRRFVLQEGSRDTRSRQIEKMRKKYIKMGKRPPLTKEQKLAGARRII